MENRIGKLKNWKKLKMTDLPIPSNQTSVKQLFRISGRGLQVHLPEDYAWDYVHAKHIQQLGSRISPPDPLYPCLDPEVFWGVFVVQIHSWYSPGAVLRSVLWAQFCVTPSWNEKGSLLIKLPAPTEYFSLFYSCRHFNGILMFSLILDFHCIECSFTSLRDVCN